MTVMVCERAFVVRLRGIAARGTRQLLEASRGLRVAVGMRVPFSLQGPPEVSFDSGSRSLYGLDPASHRLGESLIAPNNPIVRSDSSHNRCRGVNPKHSIPIPRLYVAV